MSVHDCPACRFTSEQAAQLAALVDFNNCQWPGAGCDWQGYLARHLAASQHAAGGVSPSDRSETQRPLSGAGETQALRYGATLVPVAWGTPGSVYVRVGKWQMFNLAYSVRWGQHEDNSGIYYLRDSALEALASAPPPPGWEEPSPAAETPPEHAGDGLEDEARVWKRDRGLYDWNYGTVANFARVVRNEATRPLLDKIARLEAPLACVTQERDELRERVAKQERWRVETLTHRDQILRERDALAERLRAVEDALRAKGGGA